MVDIRQTVQYANYLSKIDWVVERISEINYFIKKIPLVGSIIKIQRPEEIRINKIRELSKKYRAFQIIIEPKTEFDAKYLSSLGFRLSKSPYLPTKTLQLDLTKSREALWRNLEKDAKSAILEKIGSEPDFYNYKKLIKSEAINVVKTGKNLQNTIGLFREGWKRAVKWKRYVPPFSHLLALKKLFEEDSLFLVTPNYSSGAIFLIGDKIGFTGRHLPIKRVAGPRPNIKLSGKEFCGQRDRVQGYLILKEYMTKDFPINPGSASPILKKVLGVTKLNILVVL